MTEEEYRKKIEDEFIAEAEKWHNRFLRSIIFRTRTRGLILETIGLSLPVDQTQLSLANNIETILIDEIRL